VVEVLLASEFTAHTSLPAGDIGYFVSRVRDRAHLDTGQIGTSLDTELTRILRPVQE
jgi:hypothetical protein